MRSPLSVRIFDHVNDRLVTSHVHDLTFSKTAPGGDRQASCELWLPPSQFDRLGPADRLYVYDPTIGRCVWDGYTENPGERAGPGGLGFELSAQGGMVRAADQAEKLPYVDRDLDNWVESSSGVFSTPSSTHEVGQYPATAGTRAGQPALFLQFQPGSPVAQTDSTAMEYAGFKGAGINFGALRGFRDTGGVIDYRMVIDVHRSSDTAVLLTIDDVETSAPSGVSSATQAFDIGQSYGVAYPQVRLTRIGGATNVATDNVWAALGQLVVHGALRNRFGTLIGAPRTGYVLASEIVEDLLGRLLSSCDVGSAVVEPTTYQIDSLSFTDATTAANILDALIEFEPDFDWGIGPTRLNGKHSFWFRKWPTSPRYVLTDADDINLPGSEDTLSNRVAVEWTDEKGRQQITIATATVPELGDRIKDADKVTLPEGRGSLANAQRIGEQVLAAKNQKQIAGTATVGRPIMDLVTGQRVMPWNLEPGCVARLQSRGVDVRVTETSYTDNDVATTLTLGTPVPSVEELITELAR